MNNRPWEDISLDMMVNLPRSKHYDAILAIVDRFSKMVKCIPTQTNVTALQLAKLFLRYVVADHGVPKTLITDRDPKFMSHFWEEFFTALNTKLKPSTAYHPQTDGQTERANRVITETLKHYVDKSGSKWSDYLPLT